MKRGDVLKALFPITRRHYRNLRIKHKLILLITFSMLICYGITFSALQYAYLTYDEQIYERSSQVLSLSVNGIENEMKKIDDLSFNMSTDPAIQLGLKGLQNQSGSYEHLRAKLDVMERIAQLAGAEKYLYSASIIDLAGNIYTSGQAPAWAEGFQDSLIKRIGETSGEANWMDADPSDPALITARLVRSYTSNNNLDLTPLGIIVIRIRMERIVQDISAGTDLKNGELIIRSGQQIQYPKTGEPVDLDIKEPAQKDGYEIRKDKGETTFISYTTSSYTGWKYYSLIPFDYIFNRIMWMKNVLIIIYIASFLMLSALAFRFSRSITRPIERLIDRMKQVKKGDLSSPWITRDDEGSLLHMDEVGQLHRTFRMMIEQINELIHENYTKQLTIRDTQFRALQAQINPHFLYNTLETINWQAKLNGQKDISRTVESLGFLLRSSISLKETLITLDQELNIIRHYITIQQFRFGKRLDYQEDIPLSLLNCPMPKLLLQPLVENAIKHGLEMIMETCSIKVAARKSEDGVLITISDNGPGMRKEVIENLLQGKVVSNGSGIGLSNIRERLEITFGPPYGLSIARAVEGGTTVSLLLPYDGGSSYV